MPDLKATQSYRKTAGEDKKSYALLQLTGFIDAPNYNRFESALERLLAEEAEYLVLDFSGVEYINSTGISAIIRVHNKLAERGGSVMLVQVPRSVGLSMHLLGMTTLVPFLKTLEQAEEHIDSDLATSIPDSFAQDQLVAPVGSDQPLGTVVVAIPRMSPIAKIIARRVSRLQGKYQVVHSIPGVFETLGRWSPDLIVVDHRLPESETFVEKLKVETDYPLTSVLMMYEPEYPVDRFRKTFKIWENDYLLEPFPVTQLLELTESELKRVPGDRRLFSQQVRLDFSSDRSQAERGLAFLEKALQRVELPESELTALLAAIKEAIDNAVLHGNRHNPEQIVKVNLLVDPNKVTILVEDEGEGFDHEFFMHQIDDEEAFENAKARISEEKRGGLGILLMHRCSDRLEYSGYGNIVRIEKNLLA